MPTSGEFEELDCLVHDGMSTIPATRRVAAEEPLCIYVNGQPLAVLTRTPGFEQELCLGYLLTEGFIGSPGDVVRMEYLREAERVEVELAASAEGRLAKARRTHPAPYGPGRAAGRAEKLAAPIAVAAAKVSPADLQTMSRVLRSYQRLFEATGGTHAAALSPDTPVPPDGPVIVREDVGRCNAVDKVVGACYMQGLILTAPLLFLTGRLSLETVAKAAQVGIGAVAGIGAPTTSAVRLARRLGMFLAGFVRGDTFTVYAGSLASPAP